MCECLCKEDRDGSLPFSLGFFLFTIIEWFRAWDEFFLSKLFQEICICVNFVFWFHANSYEFNFLILKFVVLIGCVTSVEDDDEFGSSRCKCMLICANLIVFNFVLTCMIEFCVFGIDWDRNWSFDRTRMVEITHFNVVVLSSRTQCFRGPI